MSIKVWHLKSKIMNKRDEEYCKKFLHSCFTDENYEKCGGKIKEISDYVSKDIITSNYIFLFQCYAPNATRKCNKQDCVTVSRTK